jgi:hypothetical protein
MCQQNLVLLLFICVQSHRTDWTIMSVFCQGHRNQPAGLYVSFKLDAM